MNSNSTSRIGQLAGVGLALAAFLLLLPAHGHADTLNVTDDAHTRGTSTSNFGSKKTVKVDDSKSRVGFAKFDLSVLGGATGADIDTATLRIFISKVQRAGDIDIDTVDADWSEGTITGANAPTTTPIASLQNIGIAAADKKTFVLVNVDVTTLVKGWLDGADNFGIAILPDGARIDIDSKENKKTSHPMEIEVTTLRSATLVSAITPQIIGGGIGIGDLVNSATRFVGMFHGSASDPDPLPQTSLMPLEGVVSDFFVAIETDPGDVADTYTFTIQRDPTPLGAGGGANAGTAITCTITGTDPAFSCKDDVNSQCYEVGDGILVEVVPVDTPAVGGMTWTAVVTPCACTGATCD